MTNSFRLRRVLLTVTCAAFAFAALSASARASTIFSNLPGNTTPDCIMGPACGMQGSAAEFTPSANTILDAVTVDVDNDAAAFGGGNSGVTIEILSGSSIPNSSPVLESWSLSSLPATANTPVTVTDTIGLNLLAGTDYWVAVLPVNGSDTNLWYEGTSQGSPQAGYYGFWLGASGFNPGFEVTGQAPVPAAEVSSLALLALVLLAFGGVELKNKYQRVLGAFRGLRKKKPAGRALEPVV